MKRDEYLEKLKSVSFCALPTVATMDMGLEYDYVCEEGAGTGFGGMGSWPAYMISGIETSRWTRIKKKVEEKELSQNDLEGTELGIFIESIFENYYGGQIRELEINDLLHNLIILPDILPETIYILFDMGGVGYEGHRPEFYISEDEMKEAFKSQYCSYFQAWEDMDDEELELWYSRLDTEFDSFPCFVIGDDE